MAQGLGIATRKGTQVFWHDGGTGGFRSWFGFDKTKKVGVVILSNSANNVDDIGFHILIPKSRPYGPYKYKWLVFDTINSVINSKGIDEAIALFYTIKTAQTPEFVFDADQLANVGLNLLEEGRTKDAIAILKLNAKEYPTSWRTYDSLVEAYMKTGDNNLAIRAFERAVELNPDNSNGKRRLKKLSAK